MGSPDDFLARCTPAMGSPDDFLARCTPAMRSPDDFLARCTPAMGSPDDFLARCTPAMRSQDDFLARCTPVTERKYTKKITWWCSPRGILCLFKISAAVSMPKNSRNIFLITKKQGAKFAHIDFFLYICTKFFR